MLSEICIKKSNGIRHPLFFNICSSLGVNRLNMFTQFFMKSIEVCKLLHYYEPILMEILEIVLIDMPMG